MDVKYRWMQKKDLANMSEKNRKEFINLIKNKNTVANIVESKNGISGWMVYKVYPEVVVISKIGFKNEEIAEFMINNLIDKKGKRIVEAKVSEYDLRMQIILKDLRFVAKEIITINQVDFYKFICK